MRIALPAPDETVVLENVRPQELGALLDALGDSPARRIAYDSCRLEVMSPSEKHERVADLLALLVRSLAEALGFEVLGVGSWTLRAGLDRAVEADRSFYVGDEERIVGLARRDLDLTRDPPPDLAIEVDVTVKSIPRLPIYAAVGVPEIWRFENGTIEVFQLLDGRYEGIETSRLFSGFPVKELARFVDRGLRGEVGDTRLGREFRDWVRGTGFRPGSGTR